MLGTPFAGFVGVMFALPKEHSYSMWGIGVKVAHKDLHKPLVMSMCCRVKGAESECLVWARNDSELYASGSRFGPLSCKPSNTLSN